MPESSSEQEISLTVTRAELNDLLKWLPMGNLSHIAEPKERARLRSLKDKLKAARG